MLQRGSKKGQVAIFIIVAIVIVALVIAFYAFRGKITLPFITPSEINPSAFMADCLQDDITSTIETLSKQGGYMNPEGYIMYQGEKVKYLCYTAENFKRCVVQQPSIKTHFEEELTSVITSKVASCFDSLKSQYQSAGYSVSAGASASNISIVPSAIRIDILTPLTITKGEVTRTYSSFTSEIRSEMYDLLMIAGNIIEFEAFYGDSATDLYIQNYPNIKINKIPLDDGSRIYTVSSIITKESFTFASRSLVWPAGYGLEAK